MNDPIKTRINTIGKIGKILAAILFVLSIVGTVFCAIGAAVSLAVPKDAVTLTLSADVKGTLGGTWIREAAEKANAENVSAEDAVKRLEKIAGLDLDLEKDVGEVAVSGGADNYSAELKTAEKVFTVRDLFFPLLSAFLASAASVFLFYALKKLMREFQICETPFSENVIQKMNLFAVSLVVIAVVNTVAESAWGSFLSSGFHLSLDLSTLLVVAVLLLVIAIFKYGCRLQKESDEIL